MCKHSYSRAQNNMVCFSDYGLRVPNSKLAEYRKYVLENVYSLGPKDLKFLDQSLPFEERRKSGAVTLTNETNEYYEITFRICAFTALVNVLPTTTIATDQPFYTNATILAEAKDRVDDEVYSACSDVGIHRSHRPIIESNDLNDLVKQLALDNCIQLNDSLYLCVASRVPFYFGTKDCYLFADICYKTIYDVDDGFLGGEFIDELNVYFSAWKNKDDVTAPVIPCNILKH